LPVKSNRTEVTRIIERVFFLRDHSGAVLLEQETGKRRTGLWKLPALPKTRKLPKKLHSLDYTITRYRVALCVHAAPEDFAPAMGDHRAMIASSDIPSLPMPSPYRRALNALLAAPDLPRSRDTPDPRSPGDGTVAGRLLK
jgi:A/G-specific adenine glycosylase